MEIIDIVGIIAGIIIFIGIIFVIICGCYCHSKQAKKDFDNDFYDL